MAMVKVPISKLVEDFSLYPRRHVDEGHVANLTHALASGEELPPPVVDGQFRIIDGFHRVRARVRHDGPDVSIKVDQRRFASETDALKEAIHLNATHARKLDEADRTRAILLLQERGVETHDIAAVLHTTEERVHTLSVRVVMVEGHPLPAKRSQWPKKGEKPRKLTAEQYTVVQSGSGWHAKQAARQLCKEITNDLLDVDAELAEVLTDLQGAIAALNLEVTA